MATVPIVTEVTKEQLDALVASNGLNEGLQYKVIDKNWLLTANSSNTLVSSNGILIILYNDTLPDYIDSKKLLIDTGNLTNTLDNTPININVPDFHIFAKFTLKNNNTTGVITSIAVNTLEDTAVSLSGWEVEPGKTVVGSPNPEGILYNTDFDLRLNLEGNSVSSGEGIRAIFETIKMDLL